MELDKLIDIHSTFEFYVYSLFHINIENLIEVEVSLAKDPFSLSWKDVEAMPYWQYELYLKLLNKRVTEENKQTEEQQKSMRDMNPSHMMRDAGKMMPKMPNMSAPKMSMPKF